MHHRVSRHTIALHNIQQLFVKVGDLPKCYPYSSITLPSGQERVAAERERANKGGNVYKGLKLELL